MPKSNLEIFDPIREYLLAALDACPNGLANRKCPTEKSDLLQKFYENQYYNNQGNLKHDDIPKEFTKRVLKVADNLHKLDRNTTHGTLVGALLTKAKTTVGAYASKGSDLSGGLSNILNIETKSMVGGAPFKATKLIGSYSDNFLKEITSDIKKVYNQFGGFTKTQKEVIGTHHDLNNLLLDDLLQQINNSLEKRYYKNYLTGGASADAAKVLKVLKSGNVDQKDLDIFNAFMMVMRLENGDHNGEWQAMGDVTRQGLILKANDEYRLNLKKESDQNNAREPIIEFFIPRSRGMIEKEDGHLEGDHMWLKNEFREVLRNGAGGRNFDTTGSLTDKLNCDKLIRDELSKTKEKTAAMMNDPFERNQNIVDNSWVKRNDGTYEKHLDDGSVIVYKENTSEYDNLLNKANQCFSSAANYTQENCCEWMKAVLKGDAQELLNFLKAHPFNWIYAPKDINSAHPVLVLKVLQAFGFREEKVYDINSVGNGSKIWKIQKVNTWKNKYLNQKFKQELVDHVMANTDLRVYLDLLVDYVNQNPSLINDHLVNKVLVTKTKVPDVLEKRGVIPCENPSRKAKYSTDWNTLSKNINNIYGDFYKGLNFKSQLPFGMTNLFPTTQTWGYGNVFRGTTLYGGKPDGIPEIFVDVKPTAPQFTHQVSVEIMKLLDKLGGINKSLSKQEILNIKNKLENFSNLETQLYNQLGMINTYTQLANYLNKDDEEIIDMQHVINYVNKYQPLLDKLENTKTGLEGLLTVLKEMDDENDNVLEDRPIHF
jgi:hypothetical protein